MSIAQELKQNLDIVEIISDYVDLHQSGRNFKALCPFHQEKTPSFYVFTDRGTWHCFGACGEGGDVFSFVMKKESIEFGEALQLLARRTGFRLPERGQPEKEVDQRPAEVVEAAASYYSGLLLNSGSGRKAKEYLERRGVNSWAVQAFGLGYSLPEWDGVKRHLLSKRFTEKELIEAGLLVQGDSGAYDRFRDRLMFPIRDQRGRVVGFGARSLDDSLPKYINSPQTPVFDKGGVLYGLDLAREAIKQRGVAVIVEGYMDVITAHQHGQRNVVASMGTSLTEKQVRLLKGLTKNVTLALDPDTAGDMATVRGIGVAAGSMDSKILPIPTWSGVIRYERYVDGEIKVVTLPRGKDPDELIKESVEEWERLIDSGLPVIDFVLTRVAGRVDLGDHKSKRQVAEEALPFIAELPSPITQAHYLQKLAGMIRVEERDLRDKLRQLTKGTQKADTKINQGEDHKKGRLESAPVEEYVLSLLMQNPELKSWEVQLRPEHFTVPDHREIFRSWQRAESLDEFFLSLDQSLHDTVDSLAERQALVSHPEALARAVNDSTLKLEERRLRDLMDGLRLVKQELEGNKGANHLWKMREVSIRSPEDADAAATLAELRNSENHIESRLMALLTRREILQAEPTRIGEGD